MQDLNLSSISEAASFLQGKINRTPIEFSPGLSSLLQVPVYLKLEFFQITGSFKIRGALLSLSKLNDEQKKRGVATCSSGNHGLGIAYAAKQFGIDCTVYVPKNVDEAKYKKMIGLGAQVIKSAFIGYDDTNAWSLQECAQKKQHFISAYDDEIVMAGNGGTIAQEILEDLPEAENFIVPFGGGGLSAGLSFYTKEKNANARIFCCQHVKSPSLSLSLEQGKAVTRLPPVETVAGGIEGGLGERCFSYLKDRISGVALLSEEEIIKGVCWLLENHQYLVEPSAAAGISACLFQKLPQLKGATVIVLTGRNVSYPTLQGLLF